MSERKSQEKLELTQKHAVIFADMICGAPVKHTMSEIDLSKTQIINVRNRIKRFLRKDFDHNDLRKRVLGLAPLVVKNIAMFLLEGDKEVTLKCAEGFGFLFKNHDDLMEMLASLAVRGDTHLTVNVGGGDAHGRNERFGRLADIYKSASQHSRFDISDN